ncbi:energy transducer TonB, partial [Stenotrophomonas maltophilia]
MSAPRSSSAKSFTVHIPRNALKIAGIAFGVGVLLFVLVWLTGRDKEFFRADPAAQTPQETAQVEPLPEPLAAAAGSSDMPDAKPAPVEEEAPKLVETAPPPPAPIASRPRPARAL